MAAFCRRKRRTNKVTSINGQGNRHGGQIKDMYILKIACGFHELDAQEVTETTAKFNIRCPKTWRPPEQIAVIRVTKKIETKDLNDECHMYRN